MKYKTLILPTKTRLNDVCSPMCHELIDTYCQPVWNYLDHDLTSQEVINLVEDVDIILTSWGSPVIHEEVLLRAKRLKAIAHAAGSVKQLVPRSAFEHGIVVFSAAPRIAQSVGEYCLAALLNLMNRFKDLDQNVRTYRWKEKGVRRNELAHKRIGLVSASSTARAFLQFLKPFHCEVIVYDPYLHDEEARELGVSKGTLEEIFACDVISLHAPSIPETKYLITGDLLKSIPEGAIFINSSRTTILDEHLLIKELQTGRFYAALDVYETEPLLDCHPFVSMNNVLLTPHVAGDTVEGHQDLMYEVLKDVIGYLEGEQPKYALNPEKWDTMA
ncbi:hydroxyacid dehydrogenase [Alicyclobacillus fastidiosus]|uniref:Hydroxyacid dehydrogenase n=1 Tax=Alicyclobacillus fastidiosus TaxID=392011 RepID=A0ABY6ZBB8_9BACL|nr:hydroxyacid dehydrogenase [Alicyclobacillus fastidiosus]WAH39828.1 hydroxyacid dehydrogenase [Alicyclobacillus fastidiosus]GMA61085.1 2-hydroxyacid dehydrogenase [Alicyclobacillus fastidiosus]